MHFKVELCLESVIRPFKVLVLIPSSSFKSRLPHWGAKAQPEDQGGGRKGRGTSCPGWVANPRFHGHKENLSSV